MSSFHLLYLSTIYYVLQKSFFFLYIRKNAKNAYKYLYKTLKASNAEKAFPQESALEAIIMDKRNKSCHAVS